jgi:hypothetical protein
LPDDGDAMADDDDVTAAVRARLRSIIMSFAEANAESHPTNLRVVETDSTSAVSALSPGVIVNQAPMPVYVVVANGDFVGYMTKRPLGAPPPKGTTLWVLLNSNGSFSAIGWGLGHSNPNLRKLGAVSEL